MTIYAIYKSPEGAPAPFLVQAWTAVPGGKPSSAAPVFAATIEQARGIVPRGLFCHLPEKDDAEARGLLETWSPEAP